MTTANPNALYTGNNVVVTVDGAILGFVETFSVTRNVGRSPKYGVGSPLFLDAPVTQAVVNVTANNLVPLVTSNALNQNNVPTGSLAATLNATPSTIDVYPFTSLQNGTVVGQPEYSVSEAYFTQDSLTVPNTDVLTYNVTWIARDTQNWS